MQSSQTVYFGDAEGNVICSLAYGDAVKNIPPEGALNSLVNVSALKPRPGQLDILYLTEDTKITQVLEPVDQPTSPVFPYNVSCTSKDFATFEFLQGMKVGEYVALVIKVLGVDAKTTADKGESYLVVTGVDMDKAVIAHLRLWRYEEGDVVEGNAYIMRGLKVAEETIWDDEKWKYVARGDGTKKAECKERTAMEDVTHIDEIMDFFR